MILISKTLNNFHLALMLVTLLWLFFPGHFANAQGSLTLSVSPTLFEMTASPEQTWESSVRVINANSYDINVYLDVVNFVAEGEVGQGKFEPVLDSEAEGQTLAEWILPDSREIVIPAQMTVEIPFSISVPVNAAPGGHFAALLVGTKSINDGPRQTVVETSQVVTSLVFLRVTGDVIEDGLIRSFRTTNYLSEKPDMNFELRFENKGNVHILPQGEIKILNMWGQERGIIPVNRQTLFGNVLPQTIRKYTFSWVGDWSLADMGRYTAVATLAYGEGQRKFASSETAFWVLPWKAVTIVLFVVVAFLYFITWSIKLYIRKMLSMAGVSAAQSGGAFRNRVSVRPQVSVVAPLEEGILDLSQRFRGSHSPGQKISSFYAFVRRYKLFFISMLIVGLFVFAVVMYVTTALKSDRSYEVVIEGVDNNVTFSSEELEYQDLIDKTEHTSINVKDGFPAIKIINQSGVAGLAAELRVKLEMQGYPVVELTNELYSKEANTVIVYAPEYAEEALSLSRDTYGALTSAYAPASGTETPIVIYVGKDLESAVQ